MIRPVVIFGFTEQLVSEVDFKFAPLIISEDHVRAKFMILALTTNILVEYAVDRKQPVMSDA